MGIEIERKFLVNKDRWNEIKTTGILYKQGYMLRDENKNVRVRLVEGKSGYLTIKGKTIGFTHPEYEYAIPLPEAEDMLRMFCEAVVVKKRYVMEAHGKRWEVDEFLGDNEGLVVAELELSDEEEEFDLPEWIDYEVSYDSRYYNSQLSVHPFKDWVDEVEEENLFRP